MANDILSQYKVTNKQQSQSKVKPKPIYNESDSDIQAALNANHIYRKDQIDRFTKFSRFGFIDPYNTNTVTKEYIFFTKMDLHLFEPNTNNLNPEIQNNQFFVECFNNYKETMYQLQESVSQYTANSPFCNLLSNTVASSLELPDISMQTLETAANIAGTKMEYPLAVTDSSNMQDFSLDFEDTKHLDVYMFFRIWYEYELLKKDGLVTPPKKEYIINKILHDQMSCYKIIVGEDGETIIHWSKYWGVYPSSIPRSIFGDLQDGPIKISVSFKSQWVEDMDPLILQDFNAIVQPKLSRYNKDIPIYDTKRAMINGQWCNVPYITRDKQSNKFKLKWR